MSTTHTPGPWIFKSGQIFTRYGRIAGDISNEDDGHLIATAPSLLAVAKFVVEHPEAARGMGDVPHELWVALQRMAISAVADAEGKFHD